MIGAIIGDIIGSRFEFFPIKTKDFDLFNGEGYIPANKMPLSKLKQNSKFTDDTIMTLAICKSLLDCNGVYDNLTEKVIQNMQTLGKNYPLSGYGFKFNNWLHSKNPLPYNSYGNGSAMRVSAVPYFASSLKEVKSLTKAVTEVTHNHPEGLKGAEATAVCIWFALKGKKKEYIEKYVKDHYYSLDYNYDELIKNYKFDETCQGSVPQSLFAFFISTSYEDAVRTAISLGGDSDTMACITGGIAGAYYGVPQEIEQTALKFLSPELKEIVDKFVLHFKKP